MRLMSCCAVVLAGIAVSGSALAADLVVYEPMVAASLPTSSGGYLGLFGGYGILDAVARDYPGNETPYSASGFLAGVRGGYDWQMDSLVVGVVGDVALASIAGTVEFGGPVIFKIRQQWEASLRGRIGYRFDGVLPYLTAGLAYGGFETQYSQVNLPFLVADTDRLGWTVGAGVEVPLSDDMSLVGEYRYTDYGTEGSELDSPDGPYTIATHQATLGVNFHF